MTTRRKMRRATHRDTPKGSSAPNHESLRRVCSTRPVHASCHTGAVYAYELVFCGGNAANGLGGPAPLVGSGCGDSGRKLALSA